MTSGLLARLEGQVLGAVETLRKAATMARAEGRGDLALPLAAIEGALQVTLTEVAAARRAGAPWSNRGDGEGAPLREGSEVGGGGPLQGASG